MEPFGQSVKEKDPDLKLPANKSLANINSNAYYFPYLTLGKASVFQWNYKMTDK